MIVFCLFKISLLFSTLVLTSSLFFFFQVPHLLADLDIHIRGLNKKYVLDNSPSLLSIIRECNFTLRWVLLHRLVNLLSMSSFCLSTLIIKHHSIEIINIKSPKLSYSYLSVILHSNILLHRPVIKRQGTW